MRHRPELERDLARGLGAPTLLWGLMSTETIMRFLGAPSLEAGPTRVSSTLPLEDLPDVLVLRHARIVLEALGDGDGAKLTATGNLSRRFVREMLDRFDWREYEKEDILRFNKVVNETDFTPLHYLRVLMQVAGLIRKRKGYLKPSRRGRDLLAEDAAGKLMHLLFTTNFDAYNTGYLDRTPIQGWPQEQIGLVLYLLSQATADWSTALSLMQQTTIPTDALHSVPPDHPEFAFLGRVLRYLQWFGLIRQRPKSRLFELRVEVEYRKIALYDRFLSFEVNVDPGDGAAH